MSGKDDLTFNQQAFVDNIGCDPELPGVTPPEVAAYNHAKKFSEQVEPMFQRLAEVSNPLPNFGDDGHLISGEKVDDAFLATRLVMDSQEVISITRLIDLTVDRFIENSSELLDLPVAREYVEKISTSNREVYLNAKMTMTQVGILAKGNGIDVRAHFLKTMSEGTTEEKYALLHRGRTTVEEIESLHPHEDMIDDGVDEDEDAEDEG